MKMTGKAFLITVLAVIASASLLIGIPAYAQQQVTTPKDAAGSGTLTTITTDFVTVPISGGQWATVQFMATVAGTSTVTALTTNDGVNWLPAPYAKRLSTVSVNPTVQAISATTLVANDVWEIPLPGNTVKFQLLCAATGTATNVVVRAGVPYVPGSPVTAVLYDVTEGSIGVGLPLTIVDIAGWDAVSVTAVSPTGVAVVARNIDDTGNTLTGFGINFTAATSGAATWAKYGSLTSSVVASGNVASVPLVARRLQWSMAAGGTVSQGRIRVEARR